MRISLSTWQSKKFKLSFITLKLNIRLNHLRRLKFNNSVIEIRIKQIKSCQDSSLSLCIFNSCPGTGWSCVPIYYLSQVWKNKHELMWLLKCQGNSKAWMFLHISMTNIFLIIPMKNNADSIVLIEKWIMQFVTNGPLKLCAFLYTIVVSKTPKIYTLNVCHCQMFWKLWLKMLIHKTKCSDFLYMVSHDKCSY